MINRFATTAIVVSSDGLGQAEPVLRHRLAVNYFRTLLELGQLPQAVLFYADGVKLVTDGSLCLKELQDLARQGVPLIVCRTCLEHFGLIDRLAVGEIGNMLRIVEMQAAAAKVITV